jgi:hypothetical protein
MDDAPEDLGMAAALRPEVINCHILAIYIVKYDD